VDGELVERAIALAEGKLGARYVWATAGPETFDCSGFTHWVASRVLGPQEYELRSSHHQFNVWGEAVEAPWRGDLVFFDTMGVVVMGNRASHVGIALGDGRFIHAANEALGVRIDGLGSEWYRTKYIGARRIFGEVESGGLRVPVGVMRARILAGEVGDGVVIGDEGEGA
jgi:cell wall-associated NlpC family hydrolase